MDTNATCRIWMEDQLLQRSAAGEVCRVADESGVPYRMVPLAGRHSGSPMPSRDSGAHWHLLITPEQLRGADRDRLIAFDDVVSLSSPSWQAELRSGLGWLQRVDELTRRLERDVGIVGCSQAMVELRKQMAQALLDSEANVLILGETGTGKRVIAEALHRVDERRSSHASTRARPSRACSAASCSATCAGHSRARASPGRARFAPLVKARCCSTRSVSCR